MDEFEDYKDYFSLQAQNGGYNKGKLYTTIKGEPVKVALRRKPKPNKGATIIIGFFHGNELIHECDLFEAIGLPALFKRRKDAKMAGLDQEMLGIINDEE